MPPRIYIYKITFLETPHYYYGVHKEKVYEEEYWGSPITNKSYWEIYTPQKEILKVFDNSEENWLLAQKEESDLIRPFYKSDPLCLNESCGGLFSTKAAKQGGYSSRDSKVGVHGMSTEERRRIAKDNERKKVGIFKLTAEERKKNSSISGKISGRVCYEKGSGIFSMDPEEKKKAARLGGSVTSKKLNSQRWRCTITGYVTTPGPLTRYQKARGINVSCRELITSS